MQLSLGQSSTSTVLFRCTDNIYRVWHVRLHSTFSSECVCCHPIYSGRQTCGRTSRGHTGRRSHKTSAPSLCGACLNFIREKDSAVFSLVNREVELHFQQSRVWINRVWLPRSAEQESCFLPCPSSRLKVWFCEMNSAISFRVNLLIIHTQAVSGTCSRDFSRFLQRRPQIHRQPQSGQPLL